MVTAVSPFRHCEAKSCPRTVDGDKVFCMEHWGKLPQEIQERMVESYHVRKQELRLPNPSWDMAKAQAINFLSKA